LPKKEGIFMNYPKFFDAIEPIVFKDELAELLGAAEDGIIEFRYIDVVKAAGHSCPTVAGAYLLVQRAMKELYIGNRIPVRGNIEVNLKDSVTDGVTGVMANIFSHLTGATDLSGFKGLAKKYNRTKLLHFNKGFIGDFQFVRTDSKRDVRLSYDPSLVPSNPKIIELMIEIEKASATPEQLQEFRTLWQERVAQIFENADKVISVVD
jgi:hypothetical protein